MLTSTVTQLFLNEFTPPVHAPARFYTMQPCSGRGEAMSRTKSASRYRQLIVTLVALIVATTLCLIRVAPAAGQADPVALQHRLFDGINSGNVDGALALFTPDATYYGIASCAAKPCIGTAAIRDELDRLTAVHLQVTPTSSNVSGDTVTGQFQATSDNAKVLGADRVLGNYSVQSRGDQIGVARVQLDLSDPQTAGFARGVAGSSAPASGPGSGGAKQAAGDGGGFPAAALLFLLGVAALVLVPGGIAVYRLRSGGRSA